MDGSNIYRNAETVVWKWIVWILKQFQEKQISVDVVLQMKDAGNI